jgi:hypothetical protein
LQQPGSGDPGSGVLTGPPSASKIEQLAGVALGPFGQPHERQAVRRRAADASAALLDDFEQAEPNHVAHVLPGRALAAGRPAADRGFR